MTHTELPERVAVDMPLWLAKRAAKAILPHVSTDDVTPILTAAEVSGGHLTATDRYSVGRIALASPQGPPDASKIGLSSNAGGVSEAEYQNLLATWSALHEVRYYREGERVDALEEAFLIPGNALRRISSLSKSLLLTDLENQARVVLEAYDNGRSMRSAPGGRRVSNTGYRRVDVVLYDGGTQVLRQTFLGTMGNFPPVARLMDEWKPAATPAPMALNGWNLAKVTSFADRGEPILLEQGEPTESNVRAHRLAPVRLRVGEHFTALLQPMLQA